MTEVGRRAPAGIQHRLRSEAGYGCCVCGHPFFQYHHIIPWSVEPHHRLDDMMVLCPNHHDEATHGALTESEQRRYKSSPANIQRGFVNGLLAVHQQHCVLDFGSCQMVNDGLLVEVDNEPLLRLDVEGGRLLLSLTLNDEDDALLLLIDRNEWLAGDPALWDLQASYQKLVIRRAPHDVKLRLNTATDPLRLKARLTKAGHHISLLPSGIFVDDRPGLPWLSDTASSLQNLCWVGAYLSINSGSDRWGIETDPRYRMMSMISDEDRWRRISLGTQALSRLRAEGG